MLKAFLAARQISFRLVHDLTELQVSARVSKLDSRGLCSNCANTHTVRDAVPLSRGSPSATHRGRRASSPPRPRAGRVRPGATVTEPTPNHADLWDSDSGRTHFVGDSCIPPHAPLEEIEPTMAAVHLHHDDVPDTFALLNALLGERSKLPQGYTPDETGANVAWDLLTESWLSNSEKAVVHIARGCAMLERHGGGLPTELRWQVRPTVESITK